MKGKLPPFLMKKKAPAGKMGAGAPMPPMKAGKKPPMKKGKAGY